MSATTIIVNDETPRRQYVAAASQTQFDFPFPVFAAGDLQVYKTLAGATPDDTADLLTLTTHYTVTGADTQASCKVILNTGAAAGDIITIIRVVDIERTSDYQVAGDLLAETINREQDTEIMIHQQLRADIDRSLRLPITSTVSLPPLPDLQAGQYLRINDTATGFNLDSGTFSNAAAEIENVTLAAGQTVVNFTADAVTAAFYLSGPDVDNGRLIHGVDYTYDYSAKQMTLTESYPVNTKISMVYYDISADVPDIVAGANINRYTFNGDDSTLIFTLPVSITVSSANVLVSIGGLLQEASTYTATGATITFTEAPPTGTDNIEVLVLETAPIGTTDAALVSYTPAGTGVVNTTVQAKLRETISVKDFGAVGDGVTDDTAAIQAALDSGNKHIVFPEGTYIISTTLTLPTSDVITLSGTVTRNCVLKTTSAIDIMDAAGTLGNSLQYVTIQNLTFNADNASAVGLRTRHTEFLKILNCIFIGNAASTGMYMCENANEQDVKPTISNCVFGNTGFGIRGGDTRVADAIITDNFFLNNIVRCISLGYLDGGSIRSNKFFSDNGASNALEGLFLGRSIYAVIEDNAFFEMGGEAIRLTSPRRSRVINNQIVGVGDNANEPAIRIIDYDASIVASDVQITGNIIRETGGAGISVISANSNMEKFKITNNFMYDVGSGAVVYDAILLQNTDQFDIMDNVIEGNSATRYWLYLDAATNTRLRNNDHTGCVNSDVFRINSPTMVVEDSRKILTNVTTTTNITFDTDSVIGGTLGASVFMNLPAANSCAGKIFTFTKTDATAFSLILDPSGSQTIDGAATLNVNTQYQTVTLISDGSNWITV